MKTFWSFVMLIVGATLLAWFLLTYVFVTEEEQILRLLDRGRRGVESGSLLTVASLLSTEYQDSQGFGRDEVLGSLQNLFLNTKQRKIRFGPVRIETRDGEADAEVQFSFQAFAENKYSPYWELMTEKNKEPHKIKVTLRKEGRSWKIVRTDHVTRL